MKPLTHLALATLLAISMPMLAWPQGQAHVHGLARLDIAVEANRITLQLRLPLDSLVGFERAPRNDAERASVAAAVAALKAADRLFRIDPAAQCALATVELASATLKLGKVEPNADKSGHADIDTDMAFTCKDASRATSIEVGLFDAYGRLQRIEIQMVTPKGQFKRDLKRPARRIALTP